MSALRPAICTINWRFSKTLPEILDTAKAFPFQGIEIWLPHLTSVSVSRTRDTLKENNLLALCVSSPWGVCFWEHTPVLLHYGRELQAQGIKVFGDTEDSGKLVPRLKEFCTRARDSGLEVYVENHSHQPHDLAAKTLALVEAVNQPNFKIIFDIQGAFLLGEDVVKTLSVFGNRISHVHLKPDIGDPAAFARVLKQLASAQIFCSFEMMTEFAQWTQTASFLRTLEDKTP